VVEDEGISAHMERDGQVAQHIKGWCAGAGFIAADLGDVDTALSARACWVRPRSLRAAVSRSAKSMVSTSGVASSTIRAAFLPWKL
jgi:hypothetical protein